MRAAGKTEVRGQIVDHRFSGDARLGGERTRGALRRNCGREMGDVQAAQPLRCEQAAHRFAGELRIAFLANPAGLPAIVELGGGGAEMIDEIRRHAVAAARSEEHTYELQSLMRLSYSVFCLQKKTTMNPMP